MVIHENGNGTSRSNGRASGNDPPTTLWVYGYELAPPVARARLESMQAILDAGRAEARTMSRVWEGRFINGDEITHILVVSGTARNADINRRMEAELKRIDAGYSVSIPVEVGRDPGRHARWGGLVTPTS